MSSLKLVQDFIKNNVKNDLEKRALIALAAKEEVGLPTPENDLPNLKKDRIVLELVNRTNTSQSISLFQLPTGTNSAQNLNYGDLFETVYSAVTIPLTELLASQTYTINWTDEDGNPQTATTLAVDNIDNLISELNIITQDNFFYYISGTNYVIHKVPIDTWLYWNPPSVLVESANLLSYTMAGVFSPTEPKSYYANNYGVGDVLFIVTQGHLVSYRLGVTAQIQNLDLDALYAFGTAGDQFILPANSNGTIYAFSQSSKVLLRFGTLDFAAPVFELSITLANGSQGMIFTEENIDLIWSSGITAATSIFVYDENGVLLDFWSAPQLSLGSNIPNARGYSKVIYNDSGISQGYWIVRGKAGDPTNIKGLQQIGGWDTLANAIVQSFIGDGIYFEDEIQSQLGLSLNTNDEISFYTRISDTNKYFVVISNTVVLTQNYIGTVNLDTQEQSWAFYDNNDLTITGDVFYSTKTNSIIARVEYLGNAATRSINIDTLEASSENLENVNYDVGAIYYYDAQNILFKSSTVPNGFSTYTLSGGQETVPANSQSGSFYTENSFGDITGNTSTNQYFFSSFNVIGGTGISVTETIGNLTYQEIVSEIRDTIEPYLFDGMSVYTQNDSQANTPIIKVNRGAMGQSNTLINNPTIVTENNAIVLNVPINFLPQTINKLDYKIAAFNTVKIIINYTKGNLNAIAQTLNEYIEDGIPFSVGLNQLSENVSIKENEKAYLKKVLYKMWKQKESELKKEGVEIEIENLFEPQAVIDKKKNKMIGEKMKAVESMMHKQKLKDSGLEGLSPNNVKRIVSNYAAKGKADKIHDPYNYFSE
jgi:hypothetical protein